MPDEFHLLHGPEHPSIHYICIRRHTNEEWEEAKTKREGKIKKEGREEVKERRGKKGN